MLRFTLACIVLGFCLAASREWTSKKNGKNVGTLTAAPVEGGLCDANVKQQSGYYNVKSGHDKNYFFWFFEVRLVGY